MQLSKPEYDIIVMEDVMIPARDGVRLATDIYTPADEDGRPIARPWPVILLIKECY